MAGSSKEKLEHAATEEVSDEREVYLRDGRKLVLGDHHGDQLVEIRSGSGMVELRIVLTEAGPVLQMESVKLQLRAQESVEIASKRVSITADEHMTLVSQRIDLNPEDAGTAVAPPDAHHDHDHDHDD